MPSLLRETPVRRLNLPPRIAALEMEVQTDERKGNADRLRLLRRALRRERVDDMLVNEVRVAMRQRVSGQLIASGLLRG